MDKSRPLTIGDSNHFKEGVNISRGVKTETGTLIGCGSYFMGNFHAGHDSVIGNNNVLGHASVPVTIGDNAFISASCGNPQFTYIGDRVMIYQVWQKIVKDIPPMPLVTATMAWNKQRRSATGGIHTWGAHGDQSTNESITPGKIYGRTKEIKCQVTEIIKFFAVSGAPEF